MSARCRYNECNTPTPAHKETHMLFYALSADEARAIRASDMTRPCIVVILIGNA